MREIGLILLLLSGAFFGWVSLPEMRRVHQFPVDSLETELRQLDASILSHEQNPTVPPGGSDEILLMKKQRRWIFWEHARRTHNLDQSAFAAGAVGALLLLLPFILGGLRKMMTLFHPGMPVPHSHEVPDAPPREASGDE